MRRKNQYLLSLPERVLRSASALAAGLVREIGNVTLPKAVRRTRLYQTMVETTLRFLIEQVGQVEGCYPAEGKLAENFLLQRTVGDVKWGIHAAPRRRSRGATRRRRRSD